MIRLAGRSPRRPWGWGLAAILWLAAAVWIALHPVAPGSDDALFLVRGLTRFSVLDFRPQFPGYPGMVVMGRMILPFAPSPEAAMAALTAAIALALPLAATLVAGRQAGGGAALVAFLAVLIQPLLPDLALNRLTDGAGVLFALMFLALLPRATAPPRALLAGIALGWAAACRPSDAVLILAAAAGAIAARPALWQGICGGFALVIAPIAAALLIHEPLYLIEGLRFTEGHALVWGNTPFSELPRPATWPQTIATVPGAGLLLAIGALGALLSLGPGPAPRRAAAFAFVAHAVWTWAFQNPESLRHLAPLMILGPLIWALRLPGRGAAIALWPVFGLGLAGLLMTTRPDPRAAAPLQEVRAWIAGTGATLATNEGVNLLRAELPHSRVFDQHYPADAALGMRLSVTPAWRISYTPLPGRVPAKLFPRRFPGEHSLYVYAENAKAS